MWSRSPKERQGRRSEWIQNEQVHPVYHSINVQLLGCLLASRDGVSLSFTGLPAARSILDFFETPLDWISLVRIRNQGYRSDHCDAGTSTQDSRNHPHDVRILGKQQWNRKSHNLCPLAFSSFLYLSRQIGDYMLRGWTMTDRTCVHCHITPLMRQPLREVETEAQRVEFCATCQGGPSLPGRSLEPTASG